MNNRAAWAGVRRQDSASLHAVANRLRRGQVDQDLTEGQERLWRQIVAELEWRSARKRRWCKRCNCDLCQPPFPTDDRRESSVGPDA